MPQPLDYRGPRREGDDVAPAGERSAGRGVRAVVPVEFDALITDTSDHAAARAIEVQLAREGIAVFRSEEAGVADRGILLYVRGADRERAAAVAAEIFVRRRKVKALPRQRVDEPSFPNDPPTPTLPLL